MAGWMDVQEAMIQGSWATATKALRAFSPPLSLAATALQQSRLAAGTPAQCAPVTLHCVGVSDASATWLPCGKGPAATPLAKALPCHWVCPLPHVMACCPALPRCKAMAHVAALTGGGGLLGHGWTDVQVAIILVSWATTPPRIKLSPPLSRAATALQQSLLTDGTALCWGK